MRGVNPNPDSDPVDNQTGAWRSEAGQRAPLPVTRRGNGNGSRNSPHGSGPLWIATAAMRILLSGCSVFPKMSQYGRGPCWPSVAISAAKAWRNASDSCSQTSTSCRRDCVLAALAQMTTSPVAWWWGHRQTHVWALHGPIFVQMSIAMMLGMYLPVWGFILSALGLSGLVSRSPEASALVMTAEMVFGMAAWMCIRRHSWRHTVEMSAGMSASTVVATAASLAGLLPHTAAQSGTVGFLMWAGMLGAMLFRWRDYAQGHNSHGAQKKGAA